MSLRTPLGRVLGLGSAKDGTGHWWVQRVTAVGLVPLTLWLFFSLLLLPDLEFSTVKSWLALPMSSFLALLTVAVAAHHSYLGTTVVVEDYVPNVGTRVFTLLLLRFLYVLFGGAGLFAIMRVAFGS